tara:strand:+ start:297 stop:572 length:276 start_codon:yes stop_codon:yes gene_type:complete
MAKSRAIHKYKYGTYRGKQIPKQEILRRVEQSLLATGQLQPAQQEARIVTGVGTTPTQQSEAQGSTQFVEDPTKTLKDKMKDADKGTITIS